MIMKRPEKKSLGENLSLPSTDEEALHSETVEGHNDKLKAIEYAREALLSRKRFSVRWQLFLAFFIAFLFVVGIATILILTTYQVKNKLQFMEVVDDYLMEIQQARRFEKNFFLYGTNLNDALENIYKAEDIINSNTKSADEVQNKKIQQMMKSFESYKSELKHLLELRQQKGKIPETEYESRKNQIELGLRRYGHKTVSFAQQLVNKEKASVANALSLSTKIHFYSLIFLLILLLIEAYSMGSLILKTIKRFATYSHRIVSGDFIPIILAKRFQDEFTDLAIAFNYMIQELEQREAVLIQSHKMHAVGTLTAGVAHELNNPLNNITLTSYMLLEDYDVLSDEERKEMIKDTVNEAERSKKIVSNLLDFARESRSQMEPINLKELLQKTIDLAANQIKLEGIKIEFHATENLPQVHGDSQQLTQVFLNLIINAIDASPKGNKIQVLVLPADEANYVAVKIIDSGSGIPEHILPSIFDPFFTTKDKGKGTGLGLSVSQGIIAKHGGRIMVNSKENHGTTFTVILPVTTFLPLVNKT